MSLFKNIFGHSETDKMVSKVNWKPLSDLGQLNEIKDLSHEKTVVIFKHSTRCSVSRMVLKQFENEYKLENKLALYFLDLLEHRDISNEIANSFGIVHQSPQLIVIQNGVAVYNASHESIDANDLGRFF
ncbi:general stress protein [Flavobacterium psychrophilum]|uniref:Cytosolic protein n=1 Tax=Flavobacterium psychrophilum (strain ATCC 49511 / DSM 21280 / CIP 103535 / JIP02/86) TaxID=402612 RepID=A6H0L8_FLAPJ|nr:bacillithiol system redox-active protein YtxJ [Flavobacterium psychrophilum]AIG30577.1 general stress protein [Flavobacterium psychrophilum]AIG32852.1 general stress protein [Flavobacterium psychrophilum]AIG35007.1 general stress protein [Flavobacterium psychrophilum]AIG37372.1 general stress protein [Flavobacterium psychrophilum]AIG39636.1 general stress protein [Flavobacterium psychrophilum]